MADYLDDIVQKIVTRCDLTGFVELSIALQDATKKARSLGNAFRRTITGEQRVKIEQLKLAQKEVSAATALHRVELERERNAMSANRLESIRLSVEKQKEANAHKRAYAETALKLSQDRKEIQLSREKVAQLRKENNERARQHSLVRKLGRYLSAYFSIYTLKNIVDTGSRLQLVQKSIEGLTKSTQDWKYIQDQAFRTGTDIEVVAKGYRNFFSSANMAGFGKGQIQGMYGDVLLATRAIGASTQQTEGTLLALEQMISKGRVSMEELRRQLGNAIPGAFEIGAKAMNMTTKEFNDFVKTGQLASTVFVPLFIKALKEAYADGFKDIEQTVSVAQIRLSNAWKLLTVDIISGETGKSYAEGLNILRETLDSPEFKQAIIYLGKIFTLVVKLFSFVIKNLRLILSILGATGLYRLLSRHALLLRVLNMNIGRALGMLVLMGKHGRFAFAGMSTAAKAFLASLFRILVPLMAIEDLVFFLGEQFLGWNTKSAIGEAVKSVTGQNGNMSFTEQIQDRVQKWRNKEDFAGQYYKKGTRGYNQLKKALEENDWQTVQQLIPSNDSISPIGGGANLIKQETSTNNISFGDININSKSDNPTLVAQEVTNVLVNLFSSLGMGFNTEQTIA